MCTCLCQRKPWLWLSRGRGRPRGHGRGGGNGTGGDAGGDGNNDVGNNNGQWREKGARGPGRKCRPSGIRRGRGRQDGGGNNGGGGGGDPANDNNDYRPEYRDWRKFRLHNVSWRPIAANELDRFSLGAMDQRCVHCGALYFIEEDSVTS